MRLGWERPRVGESGGESDLKFQSGQSVHLHEVYKGCRLSLALLSKIGFHEGLEVMEVHLKKMAKLE